jgi:hypothetical protein
LLAGALGGLAAWAASTASRVDPAAAAAGDPIRMGRLNKASSTATTLQTKTSQAALLVNQIGAGAAVKGVATSGRAIYGQAGPGGTGVWAYSPNHYAIHALSPSVGVYSESEKSAVVAAGGNYGVRTFGTTALYAESNTTAAEFVGPIKLDGVQEITAVTEPVVAIPPHTARFFARDNGSGKTQLCVRFPTGAVQVLVTEP